MIGVLSIILIAIANVVSFSVLQSDQELQKVNFENFYWCFQVKRFIVLVLGVHRSFYSTLMNQYSFESVEAQKMFLYMVTFNKMYMQSAYKNLTMQLVNPSYQNVFIFEQAWNYPIEVEIPNSLDFSKSISFPSTLARKIIYWNNFAYYMLFNDNQSWVNSETAFVNHYDMLDGLSVINERNIANVHDTIEASQNLIKIMLIAIVTLTSLLSLIIMPIYAFNQKKREDILKLFATIPAARIQIMMSSVTEHQSQVEYLERIRLKQVEVMQAVGVVTEKERVKDVKSGSGMLNQLKRKNISATTSLIRYDLRFIPFLLVCLLLTLVNPISTYFIYSRSFKNFQAGIVLLNSMEEFFENICWLLNMKYELTFSMLSYQDEAIIDSFLKQANAERGKSQAMLTDLINQVTLFEQNESIFSRQSYLDFITPMFKGNLCEAIENSDRDFREVVVQIERCKVIFEGIFTKGIIAISKSIITYIDNFYDVAQTKDITYFKNFLLALQQLINVREELEVFTLLLFLTRIIQYFFLDIYSEYQAYILTLSTIFLSLQLVLLSVVLVFGWRKFYVYICNELFSTKQLIDIIDIDTLLNNSYVTTYFFKNNYVKH